MMYLEARSFTYANFPSSWVYDNRIKKWKLRQRGNTIGRIYFVHLAAGKRYYLRILLNIIRGAISFENLRTVEGILYPSFKEVCDALGLLQNDDEWNQCLKEAGQIQSGAQLRGLFATILLFCEPVRPERLWETHISAFSDDIFFQAHHDTGNVTLELTNTEVQNRALHHLQSILNKHGRQLREFQICLFRLLFLIIINKVTI